jgi:DNA-binding LytR/AlgR family response regulator
MKIDAVIVEDEFLAIKVLEQHAQQIPSLKIVKSFKNPTEALPFLEHHKVDLLFLDIQMPNLNGFELLAKLKNPPAVIFTTARHDYAVKAFELDVIDYLVKPVSFERFAKGFSKVSDHLDYIKSKELSPAPHIIIKADQRLHKILLAEIIYLEGMGEYVKLFTRDGMFISYGALKDFLNQLPETEFIRVHKSFIISRNAISSYSSQSAELTNGKMIPIGRAFRQEFNTTMRR